MTAAPDNGPRIAQAVAYLQAEALDDGRYRYFDHASREWWRVDVAALADLGARLDRGERDAYSLWCAESIAEPEGSRDV